jgi:hypothetical protein
MNLRERHSHTFKDPHKTERCDAAQLLAAGDALVQAGVDFLADWDGFDDVRPSRTSESLRIALAAWKKATDG